MTKREKQILFKKFEEATQNWSDEGSYNERSTALYELIVEFGLETEYAEAEWEKMK